MFSLFHRRRQPSRMLYATDMHCHLLPGVDDGSPDVDTSLELLQRMHSWGIRRVVLTPHVRKETFENTPDLLDPPLHELRQALAATPFSDMQLDRSAEYRVDAMFLDQLENGLVTPFPGDYLLVENSFSEEPYGLDNLLYDLQLRGYKPILAHPERYIYYSHYNPERYEQLHYSGILLQVNMLSLAGHYGKVEEKTAWRLVERGFADILATDLHNHRHADRIEAFLSTKRYSRLASSFTPLNDTLFEQ